MPPFSLMSGGSGPRRASGISRLYSPANGLPRAAGDARRRGRARAPCVGMFTDMGVPLDVPALQAAFREWLAEMMPSGTYRAWLVETHSDQSEAAPHVSGVSGVVVAGGGITILPWPPGPRDMGDRLAFVYNVYTEP